jgi:hypothetical protein
MSDKFKKGDYIVTLDVTSVVINCGKNNYCFKQREDEYYIQPVCDLKGSKKYLSSFKSKCFIIFL